MRERVFRVTSTSAPAVGDIRLAGLWDVVVVEAEAVNRRDWPRIWEAVGVAYSRGAKVTLL